MPDPTPTPAQLRRNFHVELRRGLGIILRASVIYFGVSYADLLPPEATATLAPTWSATTATPAGTFERR